MDSFVCQLKSMGRSLAGICVKKIGAGTGRANLERAGAIPASSWKSPPLEQAYILVNIKGRIY